ncbi:uncharacterized protein LOC109861173 [Pseudomyrmex gracilis]|uniref:uncharacterized protein LOC109861173 n=1 Tax=Pseudomyrmex gracilis TaxID=219809 RepID=UPI0009956A6D|nr:uncharacterized protein LOC109861173 [Pseudomyrmex gracilis]
MKVLIESVYMPYASMIDPPPKEEGFRADLKAQLVEAPTSFRTKNNLENAADFLKNAIANAYKLNCPPKPKSSVTKIHWWKKELEKLRLETRRKFSKAKRTRLAAHWETFRSSQQEYSKEIKKAKYKSWKHFCESIESAPEASRLHRILSLDHRPQLGCLKLPTKNVAEEASDTLKHLMEVHFSGFDDNMQPRRPKPRHLDQTKLGRNGYISAKDFRPISFTSFVLKTLERLIDGFLKNGPLLTYLLASSQYAYKEDRSTDTALHHLVSGVERQLEAKGYALGVFLDIEGAFDNTSYDVIGKAMTRHNIPAALADWTQSMLTRRTLLANHGDSNMHGFLAKGCPQGGILSPLLWCLVVDKLLYKLQKTGFLAFGYADDVAIIVRATFFQYLRRLWEKPLRSRKTGVNQKDLGLIHQRPRP